MAEQLAERDVLPFGTTPGSQRSSVVERELPLADQLENDGGDERLRDAPDPETIVTPIGVFSARSEWPLAS